VNLSQLTREQRLLTAAGACVLFVISLFLPWYGAFDVDVSAADAAGVPSWWILLLFGLAAAGLLVAEAFQIPVPAVVRPLSVATYLVSVAVIVTVMFFLDAPADRKYGIWLALVFSVVALVLTSVLRRRER
jgi:hypothetical protein